MKLIAGTILRLGRCLGAGLLLSGTGCAMLELPTLDPEPGPVSYLEWLQQASTTELQTEQASLQRRIANDGPVHLQVQQAMLELNTAEPDMAALQHIKELLDSARASSTRLRSGTDEDYLAFAGLLDELVVLRIESLDSADALAAQTRQNSELNRENQELQQTIKAITDIEQQLIEREINQDQP